MAFTLPPTVTKGVTTILASWGNAVRTLLSYLATARKIDIPILVVRSADSPDDIVEGNDGINHWIEFPATGTKKIICKFKVPVNWAGISDFLVTGLVGFASGESGKNFKLKIAGDAFGDGLTMTPAGAITASEQFAAPSDTTGKEFVGSTLKFTAAQVVAAGKVMIFTLERDNATVVDNHGQTLRVVHLSVTANEDT